MTSLTIFVFNKSSLNIGGYPRVYRAVFAFDEVYEVH